MNTNKPVNLPDEDWLFLKNEFGTDSPSEQVTKLIKCYRNHEGEEE